MTPSEVTVVAFGGRLLRRMACGLGIHATKVGPVPNESGPVSIAFCPWCGESNDRRWDWALTTHRWDLGEGISFVKYPEAAA